MSTLRSRWFTPAADSLLARTLRRGRPAWSEAVHVLWSAWVFVTPAFSPYGYDGRWWLLTALSYPVFLWLYARVLLAPAHAAWRYALGMVVLCLALLPWYPSGMSYFVFGCVFLHVSRARTSVPELVALLLLNIVFLGWAVVLGYPWQAIVWMPVVTVIVGLIVHVERLNEARDASLQLSQEEVRRLAATAERERIGRDLHDLLGHTLSMVALKSDLAARLVDRDPAAAKREIEEVARGARDALGQVRRAVSGIRAAGLAAELASARLLLEADGVAFDYSLDTDMAQAILSPLVETTLALTVREAATNVHRHARATHARATFAIEDGHAVLCIDDDGRGGVFKAGNGLAGMRERVQAVGGRLVVRGDAGCRVEVRVPLAQPQATEADAASQPDAVAAFPAHASHLDAGVERDQ
ncbi:sensor histidine kinase [Luteimonas yindakuii]|uniref:Sensor histidine kinase n=1 Tax=Luteimonas yindakuii TaxID=2565782 RepID=A0A4Z1R0F4_9GAMM|nr:sensor histidine kinase [Luteimonas yindakuii]TKS52972.1 sensor histidine kinase [Luteimonas yindakuii]